LCGEATPSPLPSLPKVFQVPGMNCMGPTARSKVVSPSRAPPSVSWITTVLFVPSRRGPRMRPLVVPAASTRPPDAFPDSTRPMPASSAHETWHPGSDAARPASAFLYAASTVAGIPLPVGALGGTIVPVAVAVPVGVGVATTVAVSVDDGSTSGAEPVTRRVPSATGGETSSAVEVTDPVPITVPIAWACAAGTNPTPVGLNAVTATTVSAPAARPVRWRSTVRDLLRLTRPAFRRAA
jgi:hypothetical protein